MISFAKKTHNAYTQHKLRAAAAGTTLDYTIIELRTYAERETTCPYCGQAVTTKTMSFDHDTPTARGGSFTKANLVVCCLDCNTIKGPLTGTEFRELLQCLNTLPDNIQKNLRARIKAGSRIVRGFYQPNSTEQSTTAI